MIDLGTTSFSLDVPVMSRDAFEEYSSRLFDEWDSWLATELNLPDYSLSLQLEEGSVDGSATVAALIEAFLKGIIAYGGLVAGVEAIKKQVRAAGDLLAERAAAPFTMLNLKPRVRRRTGQLGQLQRLFVHVQRRDLSVEDALREAQVVLGDDAIKSPEFMSILGDALHGIRRDPEQLVLPMPLPEELPLETSTSTSRSPQTRKKAIVQPVRQQWRVEVWRESRTGKREIRITEM